MTRHSYLSGLLILLREGLTPVVDDLLAGDVSQEQLDELAESFEHIAEELRTVYLAGELDAAQIDVVNDHVLRRSRSPCGAQMTKKLKQLGAH